jgi:CheY-like chemotaxis protein
MERNRATGSLDKMRTILCADDDEALLRMMRTYFEANGYVVLTETSGCTAIQTAIAAPSLYAVVLDYEIPDMSGADIGAAIRCAKPEIPIIMFSGSRTAITESALRAVDIFLDKAEGMGALLKALDDVGKLPRVRLVSQRRFPRFPVKLSIVLDVERSGAIARLNGVTTTIGEGGLGSRLDGELLPGEFVSIAVCDAKVVSFRPRAQVCYRHGEVYGLAFVGLSASQQQEIRHSFEQLALR